MEPMLQQHFSIWLMLNGRTRGSAPSEMIVNYDNAWSDCTCAPHYSVSVHK
ncbi:hypothetical protein J6590_074342 [Homalodisca vitripennis]|nr:hypothetical protein J6590_074342 [Homalodisca vitripennis]